MDIDAQARILGSHVDIGADESDGTLRPAGPYTVVRVRPGGNDAQNGSSWALAKRTVQAGINAASLLGGEVWVQAGTYGERITLPPNLCGLLEGRSRFARLGLMIHVTSAFVQPGVSNRQVLEMSNVSKRSLRIHPGVRLCQLVLLRTEGEAVYRGRFAVQETL